MVQIPVHTHMHTYIHTYVHAYNTHADARTGCAGRRANRLWSCDRKLMRVCSMHVCVYVCMHVCARTLVIS